MARSRAHGWQFGASCVVILLTTATVTIRFHEFKCTFHEGVELLGNPTKIIKFSFSLTLLITAALVISACGLSGE